MWEFDREKCKVTHRVLSWEENEMNPRIRELMIQADYPAPEIAKRAQKLVELVIRECANHILESSDRYRKEYFAQKVLELLNENRN